MASNDLEAAAFDPFRRSDRYGTGGTLPQPVTEKVLLGVLSVLVLPIKIIGALCCLVWFYAFCRISVLVPEQHRTDAVATAGKLACRSCLFCLGFVRVKWIVPKGQQRNWKPTAVVSNHCGWVDILVHMARFFPAFVARDNTKDLVMIGLISKKMGCLFVDRERKKEDSKGNGTAQGVGRIVQERIRRAASAEGSNERPMLLFPEGTTTNGDYLLPFKSGAFLAGVPVQPVILHYGKGRVNPSWESIDALQHIWLMLCIPFHTITAYELPIYEPSKAEAADPLLYAKNVRQYMLDFSGRLRPSASGLPEKRKFHALLKDGHDNFHRKDE